LRTSKREKLRLGKRVNMELTYVDEVWQEKLVHFAMNV
jgi:hypothetical protein